MPSKRLLLRFVIGGETPETSFRDTASLDWFQDAAAGRETLDRNSYCLKSAPSFCRSEIKDGLPANETLPHDHQSTA
jgi:hypothetical protein